MAITIGRRSYSTSSPFTTSVKRMTALPFQLLKNLQTLYPTSPLKEKAGTMIEVLARRAQIEDYLTKLEVTSAEEEKIIISDETARW